MDERASGRAASDFLAAASAEAVSAASSHTWAASLSNCAAVEGFAGLRLQFAGQLFGEPYFDLCPFGGKRRLAVWLFSQAAGINLLQHSQRGEIVGVFFNIAS